MSQSGTSQLVIPWSDIGHYAAAMKRHAEIYELLPSSGLGTLVPQSSNHL